MAHVRVRHGKLKQCDFWEVVYADGTVLKLKTTRTLNKLLHEIVFESAYHSMELNHAKCELIEMNKSFDVKFSAGTISDTQKQLLTWAAS